jgi:hypothetical protein
MANAPSKKLPESEVPPTRNKSWRPGQKGQGGEGMSKGYGGSAGKGTGPSGPDIDQPAPSRKNSEETRESASADWSGMPSSCLPSPERIEQVLR